MAVDRATQVGAGITFSSIINESECAGRTHRIGVAKTALFALAVADIYDPFKRSLVMSHVRSTGNVSTELRLIRLFRRFSMTGWRRGQRLLGRPDFVFPKNRLVVFVDGCFWHGCPRAMHGPAPKTRAEWWATKIAKTRMRDKRVTRSLRKDGWRVIRVRECQLARNEDRIARRLQLALRKRGLQ
jgi:DNA mismatch endonuclease (patch repair protein)